MEESGENLPSSSANVLCWILFVTWPQCAYVCVYACFVCVCVCLCLCVCVCVCVCIYACRYMYICGLRLFKFFSIPRALLHSSMPKFRGLWFFTRTS